MKWIHEQPDWPDFRWDALSLSTALDELHRQQMSLEARLMGLDLAIHGSELTGEAVLANLTAEVVHSAAIEGETLNREEVRSSLARQMGMDVGETVPVGRDVEGIVSMMLDATRNCHQGLTDQRLFDWHAALFPTGRSGMKPITVGGWRPETDKPMQVVSGPIGKERVHFEAVPAMRVPEEMNRFLAWFNSTHDLDPAIKAGVAHLWFETIHPFSDGNGRIGRAIADLTLARGQDHPNCFYSLSAQINEERQDYYRALEFQQRGSLEITAWLRWFIDCLARAVEASQARLGRLQYKAKVWQRAAQQGMNERQKNVLKRMLQDDFKGFMQTSKYAKMTKVSTDTALRDIRDLVEKQLLIPNEAGGRSTSYRLPIF